MGLARLMEMRAEDGKELIALEKVCDANVITAQELAAANTELKETAQELSASKSCLKTEVARMVTDLGFLANEVVSAQELAAAAQGRFDKRNAEDTQLASKLAEAQVTINKLQMGKMNVAAKTNYDSAKMYIKHKETRSELAATVDALQAKATSLESQTRRKDEQLAKAQALLEEQRQLFTGELAVEKAKYARLANKNQPFHAGAFGNPARQARRSSVTYDDLHMSYEGVHQQTGGDMSATGLNKWAPDDENWSPTPPRTLDLTTTLPREPSFDTTATLPGSMMAAARSARALANKENVDGAACKPKRPRKGKVKGSSTGWRDARMVR